MSDDKALKRFHGESEDPGKDLKRWKAWATAKLATLKDIKPPQKGPWLFTHYQLCWIDGARESHPQGQDSGQSGVRCGGCCI